MWELSLDQRYNLDLCNAELFLNDRNADRLNNIERKIREARANLINLMRELETVKARPAIQPISLEALESFCVQHPAMRIQFDAGVISLLSENQCVAFYTLRGRNSVARNNDIIYVTLPLYGFRLDFHPDGRVSGKAIKSGTLWEVAGDGVRVFGHPHATRVGGNSLAFQSICNGNNRFIQDWQNIMNDNSLSGPVLMRLMSQAAVWMETANLSDMYGTLLAENIPMPNVPLHAYEAFSLYHSHDVEGAPGFLKDIRRICGASLYQRCLYSIWFFRKYRQFDGKIYLQNALYEAIAADLLVMQSDQFLNFARGQFDKELKRTDETANRCLDELGGFCPQNDGKPLNFIRKFSIWRIALPKITTSETQKKPFSSAYATNAFMGVKGETTPDKDKAMGKKDNGQKTPEALKEKLPVFSPRSQNWDELPSRISSANMYALLSGDSKHSLDELAKDMSVPILAFTGTLLQEIRYITHSLPDSEHAVFLALRRIDENRPHFLAYDFFMPEQTASGGGVSLDPEDCQRHFDKLKEHPWYRQNGTHRHLCHLHSHAGMGVFWSRVDNIQQLSRDDLGFMDDFRFYCVVNTKDEIKCSLVIYKPALTRLDAVVAVSYAGEGHADQLTRKRKAELDHIIKTGMSRPQVDRWNIGASEFGEEESATQGTIAKKQDYPGFGNMYPGNVNSFPTGWGYGDTIHRYANGIWDDDREESAVKEAEVKDRKLRLDLIPVPADVKRAPTVPVGLIRSFMENSNADEKMVKQIVHLLGVLLAETGVSLEFVDKKTGEIFNEGVSVEAVGEVFAAYLCEFSAIVSNPSFYETEMPNYVSADTIKAVCRNNKKAVFGCIVNDLIELAAECGW